MNKKALTTIAIQMIKEKGLINLTCANLCKRSQIARGSFEHVAGCGWKKFYCNLQKIVPNNIIHPVTKQRTAPELRKQQIINIAILVAIKTGYQNLTRDNIMQKANITTGVITQRFGTICNLKKLVLSTAIQQRQLTIIAQGVANNDKQTHSLPLTLKQDALMSLFDVKT